MYARLLEVTLLEVVITLPGNGTKRRLTVESCTSETASGSLLGILLTYLFINRVNKSKQNSLLKIAKEEGESIKKEKILQAKEKFLELKENHEKVINTRERKMQEKEISYKQKEKSLSQKIEEYNRKDKQISQTKADFDRQLQQLEKKEQEVQKSSRKQIEALEKMSKYSIQ